MYAKYVQKGSHLIFTINLKGEHELYSPFADQTADAWGGRSALVGESMTKREYQSRPLLTATQYHSKFRPPAS